MKSAPKNNPKDLQDLLKPDDFIIAIGASAGGMGAINIIFDNTPTDGVAYVIIQHLSPSHKSFMAELLAKHSKLKIFVAENEMEVKPNCVYVMPEGKIMIIVGGKLMLEDRQNSTPNSAIDIFFNSLAEDQGDKSIAIILSGNGSDGTKGIASVKKVGGMVIVQDPLTTEYNSMPNSAIESGCFDFILTPQLIPLSIIKYIKQRTLTRSFISHISEKDEAALQEVIGLIRNYTPLDFSEYKRPTIVRRIIRRITACNANSFAEYITILKANPAEIEILSKEFLINVTRFFRDPEAFEALKSKVIPEIIKNKLLVDTLKVWVIGCSTGEEAYSLAILIREHLIEIKKDMEVKIFASDIDKVALAKASKGKYPFDISQSVSEKRLAAFFIKEPDGYKVRENIRNMMIFADHDIVRQTPYCKIDLISCRNLLIYFNSTLQKKIFSTLHFCLNMNGYLFLGPSEGMGDQKNSFSEIDKKWKIYKNINQDANRLAPVAYSPQQIEVKTHTNAILPYKSVKNDLTDNLSELLHVSHLEESGYSAGVCIDEHCSILHPFGKYDNFLLPKLFTNDLITLLPRHLSITVVTSIKKALDENTKVVVNGIKYMENGYERKVRIAVKPFVGGDESVPKQAIVYFADEEAEESEMVKNGIAEVFDTRIYTERYISDLELELSEARKRLEAAYVSLEESNDNIQSYNEELLSGNEELQSSNEELQSINEELSTVNSEYQSKIKELAELNDDLNNYFRSNTNSQIYVDKNLIIKKFTPIAMKQINVRESDIGRPLADLSTNIKFSHLIEDINTVMVSDSIKERQIETTDGRWYSMMIQPYIRMANGKSDGAIITFNDITDLVKSKQLIETANNKLVKINRDHDTFIYSTSHDLLAPVSNLEGLLSLINSTNDLQKIKELTGLLLKSVHRLKDTIKELSDISKIEDDAENAGPVNLYDLLDEVKLSIASLLLESQAKINVFLEEKEIIFSKKNLRSILLNLIINAIKYRSPDREAYVNIRSYKIRDFIILSIEDNGIGIAKEKMNKLFFKFSRIHDDSFKAEGSGIGLYLIKKMLTNAGGEIEVESELGKGSIFKAYFRS